MAWLEITVNTTPENMEATAAALTAGGFSELVMEDQQEFESFLEQNRACWDYIDDALQTHLQGLSQIKLYLEDTDSTGLSRLEALIEHLGLSMSAQTMEETDWSESWKENYPPVEVGDTFVVLPYWLAQDYSGSRLPVILDPGLTFGTGAHPSTQMVLSAMEKTVRSGDHCLDLGSGSGILSIAALRLGAEQTVGVDIDPKAEDISRENAAYNGFAAPGFTALTGDVTADKTLMTDLSARHWDTVLVNIVADVIIHLAPTLPAFLQADTNLILSGILDSRLDDVCQALTRAGITPVQILEKEDWRCLIAKKKP